MKYSKLYFFSTPFPPFPPEVHTRSVFFLFPPLVEGRFLNLPLGILSYSARRHRHPFITSPFFPQKVVPSLRLQTKPGPPLQIVHKNRVVDFSFPPVPSFLEETRPSLSCLFPPSTNGFLSTPFFAAERGLPFPHANP